MAATQANPYQSQVTNWYQNTLNRNPDQQGMDYWSGKMDGANAESVYGDFLSSANNLTGKNNTTSFAAANATPTNWASPQAGTNVDEWFRNGLKREATGAELAKYNTGDYTKDWNSFYADNSTAPGFDSSFDMYSANNLKQPTQATGLLSTPTAGTTNGGTPVVTGATLMSANDVNGAYAQSLSGYKPAVAGQAQMPTGLLPSAQTVVAPGDVTAQKANATLAPTAVNEYSADKVNVTDNMLVNNQMQNIINQDSPLMQMARTGALQSMNGRGLLNSSMAGEAAQQAVMREAMPIAQQDAATNLSVAQGNQQAENKAREFVANAKNQREIDNAKLATEVELNNVKNALQAAVANQDNARTVALENAKMNLQAQMAVFDSATQIATTNAQLANSTANSNAQIASNVGINQANNLVDMMVGNQSATNAFNNMSSQNQTALQTGYANSMTQLNTSRNAQIASINANTSTDETQKQAQIDNVDTMFRNSMGMTNALFSQMPGWSQSWATLELPK